MKKFLPVFLLATVVAVYGVTATIVRGQTPPVISNILLSPTLDVSYFGSYTLTADISPAPTSASLDLIGVNGDGGSEWNYYADGTGTAQVLSYDLTFDSGTTWKKTTIRPDHIYPEIHFAPSSLSWANAPSNINVRRNNYHLLHFTNPFTMEDDMSFWIEINATPVSAVNSADLLVYLVEKNKALSFFQSDWRSSADLELVGAISRTASFHHQHTSNSAHHLIRLSTNTDKTIGTKSLDVSSDFWVILYDTSPNANRGWDLKYHNTSLCTNTNGWYQGNITGWTTALLGGCPDVHIHMARRGLHADSVRATVTAEGVSEIQNFSFATLPNLAPNGTNFTNPLISGVYSGTVGVTWNPASDPNEDAVTYNLYLLDSGGNVSQTLITGTSSTSFSWNTADGETNGNYSLKGQACDASLCTDFYSQTFSLLNNSSTIYSLSSVTMSSNNAIITTATTGDTVTLSFAANGTIQTPSVVFYSGGYAVANPVTVTNTSGNNWTAVYTVSGSDTEGQVTFTISSSNLNLQYSEITSGSYVTVDLPSLPEVINYADDTPNTFSCPDSRPVGIPDLFQVDVSDTKATIRYTPVDNADNYYVSYSEVAGQFRHGTLTHQKGSGGTLKFTVNYLKPRTVYYFRVRGQNGCMPGEFGKELKVKTRAPGMKSPISYYKSFTVAIRSKIQSVVSVLSSSAPVPTPPPTPVIIPVPLPQPTPEPTPVTKHCFLFWCW